MEWGEKEREWRDEETKRSVWGDGVRQRILTLAGRARTTSDVAGVYQLHLTTRHLLLSAAVLTSRSSGSKLIGQHTHDFSW